MRFTSRDRCTHHSQYDAATSPVSWKPHRSRTLGPPGPPPLTAAGAECGEAARSARSDAGRAPKAACGERSGPGESMPRARARDCADGGARGATPVPPPSAATAAPTAAPAHAPSRAKARIQRWNASCVSAKSSRCALAPSRRKPKTPELDASAARRSGGSIFTLSCDSCIVNSGGRPSLSSARRRKQVSSPSTDKVYQRSFQWCSVLPRLSSGPHISGSSVRPCIAPRRLLAAAAPPTAACVGSPAAECTDEEEQRALASGTVAERPTCTAASTASGTAPDTATDAAPMAAPTRARKDAANVDDGGTASEGRVAAAAGVEAAGEPSLLVAWPSSRCCRCQRIANAALSLAHNLGPSLPSAYSLRSSSTEIAKPVSRLMTIDGCLLGSPVANEGDAGLVGRLGSASKATASQHAAALPGRTATCRRHAPWMARAPSTCSRVPRSACSRSGSSGADIHGDGRDIEVPL